jgi:hypothetical protein
VTLELVRIGDRRQAPGEAFRPASARCAR